MHVVPIFKLRRCAIKNLIPADPRGFAGDSANWLSCNAARRRPVKPDDHSEVVPLLPIPNRTVKRLSADDSAGSRVKVGHCQATIRRPSSKDEGFLLLRPDSWSSHSYSNGA